MHIRSALIGSIALSLALGGGLSAASATSGAALGPNPPTVYEFADNERVSSLEVDLDVFQAATTKVLSTVSEMMIEPHLPVKDEQTVPETFPRALAGAIQESAEEGYAALVNFTDARLTTATDAGWSMEVRQQSDTRLTAGATQRFQDGSGAYVDVDISIETPLQSGEKNPVTDSSREGAVEVKMESSTAPGVKRTTTRRIEMGNRNIGDYCPDHEGKFSWKDERKESSQETVRFGPSFLELASTDNQQTRVVAVMVEGSLGPDARLMPLKVSVKSTHQMRGTFTGAGFTLAQATLSGTATSSGTLNPKSGTVSGKGTQVSVSGTPFFEDVYGDELRSSLKSDVSSSLSIILEIARTIESKARSGGCTTVEMVPWSGYQLNRGEKEELNLTLTADHNKKQVTTTRWRVVAVKGRATPGHSKQAKPTFTVTGEKPDKEGGDSAYLNIEVVSPAGISKVVWRAREDFKFPAAYSGPVSYSRTMDLGGLVEQVEWDGNASYTLKTQKTRKDGSRYATYRLTGMVVNDYSLNWISDGYNCSYAETMPSARVVGGVLEVEVTKSGQWSSTFNIDATLGLKPRGCNYGSSSAAANDDAEMKVVMNASGPGNKHRAMPEPASAISASGVSDLFEFAALPNTRGTASWDLRPKR